MSKKNFIAIIPARANSKEIKNKNIIPIGGHPLVSFSIEAAKKSKFIEDVYVSTDGIKIAKIARQYGAKVIIRPKHMARDHSQIEDSVLYTIHQIEKKYGKSVDNVVLMQPTSPQRNVKDLDNAIKKFIKKKADSLFSCTNLYPCLWQEKKSKIKPINFSPQKRKNRQNKIPQYIENGSIYVTKRKIYETYKSRLGGKISNYVMASYSVTELDTKEDLIFLSAFLNLAIRKKLKLISPRKV